MEDEAASVRERMLKTSLDTAALYSSFYHSRLSTYFLGRPTLRDVFPLITTGSSHNGVPRENNATNSKKPPAISERIAKTSPRSILILSPGWLSYFPTVSHETPYIQDKTAYLGRFILLHTKQWVNFLFRVQPSRRGAF